MTGPKEPQSARQPLLLWLGSALLVLVVPMLVGLLWIGLMGWPQGPGWTAAKEHFEKMTQDVLWLGVVSIVAACLLLWLMRMLIQLRPVLLLHAGLQQGRSGIRWLRADRRVRVVIFVAAILFALSLTTSALICISPVLPGVFGDWLRTIVGFMSTPFILEGSFIFIGLVIVVLINHYRRLRDGDDFVELEVKVPSKGEPPSGA